MSEWSTNKASTYWDCTASRFGALSIGRKYGWAQVNHGYRGALEDNKETVACDLFYIRNISMGFDLLVMFMAIRTLLLSRGSR